MIGEWANACQAEIRADVRSGKEATTTGPFHNRSRRNTLSEAVEETPDDFVYLLGVILYEDGVAVGWQNRNSIYNSLVSLLNFSAGLQNKPVSKMNFGYAPQPTLENESAIIAHLANVCKFGITRAREQMVAFRKSIHYRWHQILLQQLTYGAENNIQFRVGLQGVKTFRIRIAGCVGDDPQQAAVCCMKANSCHHCNFPVGSTVTYDPVKHEARNKDAVLKELLRAQTLAKDRLDGRQKPSRQDAEFLDSLEARGHLLYPLSPYLSEKIPFGPKRNVYNGAVPNDIFHFYLAGLFVALVGWVNRLVIALDKCVDPRFGKSVSSKFDNAIIAAGPWVKGFPHIPEATFTKGLTYLRTKTTRGQKGNTGSLGKPKFGTCNPA